MFPQIWVFFDQSSLSERSGGYARTLSSLLGRLRLSREQATQLGVASSTQVSPYLSLCCLRLSAQMSYEQAAREIEVTTGMSVSTSTQRRLVHRQDFGVEPTAAVAPAPRTTTAMAHSCAVPAVTVSSLAGADSGSSRAMPPLLVRELSLDGGNIRLRTERGAASQWRQYKALSVNGGAWRVAFFQANAALGQWAAQLTFAPSYYCLGDGHPGIWGLYEQMALPAPRVEILDWLHLKENLYKVGGSSKRLQQAETYLWQGQVSATLDLFSHRKGQAVRRFCAYLRTHAARIPNYGYYQAEGIPIGSGSVESLVKQIDQRTQLSGAQWEEANVPQVLAHRCAFLNGGLEPFPLSKK